MKISFFGGAKSVTGANYLLEYNGIRILVDCGMFQGLRFVEGINYENFPYDPSTIDYLFLTHAHIDHIGRVPKLVRDGFRGKIIASIPTIDLAKVSLQDTVRIIAEEASRLKREPYFTKEDVKEMEKYLHPHDYGDEIGLGTKASVKILNAGHVLGSSMFKFSLGDKTITFTGDLGNSPAPLINPPGHIGNTDYLVIESAYGDRDHQPSHMGAKALRDVIKDTLKRKGVLMIPSFALERTQILLLYINNLVERGEIPQIPIFVDSPLAIRMTEVYSKSEKYFRSELKSQIRGGDQIFDFPGLEFSMSVEDSKAINRMKPPMIIIAGNGMSTAGRILHHEKRYLSRKSNTILMVGYQVEGSIGRQILDGAKEVEIHYDTVKVKAQVEQISAFSAHADNRQLKDFLKHNVDGKPKKIFIVQGEEIPAEQLASDFDDMGYDAYAPNYKEEFDL